MGICLIHLRIVVIYLAYLKLVELPETLLGESESSRSLRTSPKQLVSPTIKQFNSSKWKLKTPVLG